jgi:hypothetical protein
MVESSLDVSRVAGCQDGRLLWRALRVEHLHFAFRPLLEVTAAGGVDPNISTMARQRAAS